MENDALALWLESSLEHLFPTFVFLSMVPDLCPRMQTSKNWIHINAVAEERLLVPPYYKKAMTSGEQRKESVTNATHAPVW